MNDLAELVKDWNFVVPLVLWGIREASLTVRKRRKRSKVLGVGKGKVVFLVRDQEAAYQGYRSGMVGSLAVARACQRLHDQLKIAGLSVQEVEAPEFDRQVAENVVLVGTIGQPGSLIRGVLDRLGYKIGTAQNSISVNDLSLSPELRLADGALTVNRDYALVVKAQNPNNPDRSILIVCAATADAVEKGVKALEVKNAAARIADDKYGAFVLDINNESGSLDVRSVPKVEEAA